MGLRGIASYQPEAFKTPKPFTKHKWVDWRKERTLVEQIIAFIENLPVTSGKETGSRFLLRDWQKDIIAGIYGPTVNGKRVVRQAVLTMPRKNGKTGLTACLALVHLCGPCAESRGQIYSAAADRAQASLIYGEMKAIVEQVEELRERIAIRHFMKHMEDGETGSIYTALSAEAGTKFGLNTSCFIYDELAQAPNRLLYDALATSTGAREEPLGIVISTQNPDPNHIMTELVDYGIQIRDGIVDDPAFYAYIQTAPESADPWSEETWHACNPALGDFRSLDEMRVSAAQAQRIPAREATFRLLYLNQRVKAESRFVSNADWQNCGKGFDVEMLRGRKCYGALDLSSSGKNDLSALVLVFPVDDKKYVLPFFWASEQGLEEAEKRDRVPYQLWAKQGLLHTVPTRILDYAFLCRKIGELSTLYNIEVMAFDEWKIDQFILKAEEMNLNLTMQKHGQGYRSMDPSIQVLEDDILGGYLQHNNHPILNLHLDNVTVDSDAAGNRKFNKRKSNGRIDGAVALAMASGLLANNATKTEEFQFFTV